ncbi:MAG TPA: hypothetical protein PLM51_04670 [Bacillota bacterium]|nr:hypothetical protein [Bacillota bacterium]
MFLDVLIWPFVVMYTVVFLIILGIITASVVGVVIVIQKKRKQEKDPEILPKPEEDVKKDA